MHPWKRAAPGEVNEDQGHMPGWKRAPVRFILFLPLGASRLTFWHHLSDPPACGDRREARRRRLASREPPALFIFVDFADLIVFFLPTHSSAWLNARSKRTRPSLLAGVQRESRATKLPLPALTTPPFLPQPPQSTSLFRHGLFSHSFTTRLVPRCLIFFVFYQDVYLGPRSFRSLPQFMQVNGGCRNWKYTIRGT